MDAKKTWISILLAGLFLISVYFTLQTDRADFSLLFLFYTLTFSSYLALIGSKLFSFKHLVAIAFIAHIIAVFSTPLLSNDYFRFIWDGEMAWLGINPYDFKPVDLAHQSFIESSDYLQEVYVNLSRLSQRHYTVYPSINQFYFLISTGVSDHIYTNVVVLKLLLLATEVLGFVYFIKLLKLLNIQLNRMWILFLNPLWIIEFIGNVHFEGTMVCVLIIALYFLLQNKFLIGGVLFALTIQIKIIPLILLPFFIQFYGWKKAIRIYSIIGVVVLSLAVIYLNLDNMGNFKQSLDLYFKSFEFNSFAIFHLVQLGNLVFGFHTFQLFSYIFSVATLALITYVALNKKTNNWQTFFLKLTYGYLLFLLLSNSIHPWYALPLLFLTVFTDFSFAVVWSYLVFATYFFYTVLDNHDLTFRTIVVIEYIVLFGVMWYELRKKKTFLLSLPGLFQKKLD